MTRLSKQECIEECCDIVALAYRSIGDYSCASDGFCRICEERNGENWNFTNKGGAIAYVRQAVIEKLQRDGFTPAFPGPTYSSLPQRG